MAVKAHLAGIDRNVEPGARVAVILDGAGWHGLNARVVPDKLALLILPPYSAKLILVENVRACLCANKLATSVFDRCDAIAVTRRGPFSPTTPSPITTSSRAQGK